MDKVLVLRKQAATMDEREEEIEQVEVNTIEQARIHNGVNFQNPE